MIRILTLALVLASTLTAAADETCPLHAQHMKERARDAQHKNEAQQGKAHASQGHDHAQHSNAAAKPAPTASGHDQHAHDVDARGDVAMGFSQQKTKHTFRLNEDGGAIEVRATDAKDAESIEQIRTHLAEIAKLFPKGDFAKPQYIHGRVPDGVEVMLEKLSRIDWKYEQLDRGARVRIKTKDPRARQAIHAFLRFQIADHRTGDPTTIE